MTAMTFSLSPGQAGDGPEGRDPLENRGFESDETIALVMDKACEGDQTRQLVMEPGFEPVVPPKSDRIDQWDYNREMYKRRNEVERLFRRVFSRFEKLDVMFVAFIRFAMIVEWLHLR